MPRVKSSVRSSATLAILAISFGCLMPAQAQTTATEWLSKAQERAYNGDDQGAYQACTMAIQLDPKNVEAWNLRGDTNLSWTQGSTSKAQRDYSQALAIDPQNCHALTYRGFVLTADYTSSSKRDLANAIKTLKAIPSRTVDQERLYSMASYWFDPKSGFPVINRAAQLHPYDMDALLILGATLDTLNRPEEARVVFLKNQKLLMAELQKHCTGDICRKLVRGCTSLRDYPSGIRVLSDYLEKHPDNVHALYCRGVMFNAERRPKEALQDFVRAVELGPTYCVHLAALADAEFSKKNYREAAHVFRQLVAKDPATEAYVIKRAQSLKELSMPKLAIEELDNYLAKNPSAHNILRTKAIIEQKDNPELARKDLRRALTIISQKIEAAPQLSQLYALRSTMFVECEEPQKALAEIDQAIRLKPDDANLYNSRAHIKWNYLNLKEEAITDTNRAIVCAPLYTKGVYWGVLSVYYNGLGQYDKAIAAADNCIALSPNLPDGYKLRATAYIGQGKFQSALTNLQKVSSLNVEVDDIDLLFARVYVKLNMTKEALTAFNTSLKKHPQDLEALAARGTLHCKLEQYDSALADFNKALLLAPENGEVYLARSRAYNGMGDYSKAAADVSKAMVLMKQTDAPWLLEERARIFTYAEHYKEAALDLAHAYRYALDKPVYMFQCGKLLYWSGNKLGAIESISSYLKQVQDPLALRARARCYFETNQYEKSIADYSVLIQYDPENPALYRLRAKSYLNSGQEQLASADVNKAKSLMKSR